MGIYINGTSIYPAIVRRCGRGFEARFVDLPNCLVLAPSAPEAEKRAQSALAVYATTARRHGWAMPEPSEVARGSNLRDNYVAHIKLLPVAELAEVPTQPKRVGLIARPS
jgi:predicted RNase H-like HicB family nuclease